MKYILKQGEHHFSPRIGVLRFHTGTTFAEWRGHFDESSWYETDNLQPVFNQGSGWSSGNHRKNAISWGWRPVRHQGKKMQELCLCTIENGIRTISRDRILIPLNEDFFVQLKTNGTFASLAARTFTGDWDMITSKWTARKKGGSWLGLSLGDQHPCPQEMAINLKRLIPVA